MSPSNALHPRTKRYTPSRNSTSGRRSSPSSQRAPPSSRAIALDLVGVHHLGAERRDGSTRSRLWTEGLLTCGGSSEVGRQVLVSGIPEHSSLGNAINCLLRRYFCQPAVSEWNPWLATNIRCFAHRVAHLGAQRRARVGGRNGLRREASDNGKYRARIATRWVGSDAEPSAARPTLNGSCSRWSPTRRPGMARRRRGEGPRNLTPHTVMARRRPKTASERKPHAGQGEPEDVPEVFIAVDCSPAQPGTCRSWVISPPSKRGQEERGTGWGCSPRPEPRRGGCPPGPHGPDAASQ